MRTNKSVVTTIKVRLESNPHGSFLIAEGSSAKRLAKVFSLSPRSTFEWPLDNVSTIRRLVAVEGFRLLIQ